MPVRSTSIRTRSLALLGLLPLAALATPEEEWAKVQPTLAQYCYECHGGKKTKGGIDLKRLEANPAMVKEFDLWQKVKDTLIAGDMPPEENDQLTPAQKEQLTKWLGHSLEAAVKENAGDPGVVTMRRLTNAEYDRTIRDLTGVDLHLAQDFAPDGGGGEGFTNIGDVLFVSPQQLDKYLTAARKLADNATILPGSGIAFQAQRVGLRGPEQIRAQAEQGLYVWYQKMAEPFLPKDGEDAREDDYMLACWKWKHREQTGAPSLTQLAKDAKLVPAFLDNWWALVNSTEPKSRYLDLTRVAWRELPGPEAAQPKEVPAAVLAKIDAIQTERRSWLGSEKNPGGGVQRRQQDSDGIRRYDFRADVRGKKAVHVVLGDVGDGNTGDWVTFDGFKLECAKRKLGYLDWLRARLKDDKAALAAPNADAAKLQPRIAEAEATLAKFGKDPRGREAKPDTLVVQAPAVITLPLPDDAVRFEAGGKLDINNPEAESATVQWKATADTPPDPTKVMPGVLTVWKIRTEAARRTMGEFGVMKTAFPDEYVRRLENVARNFHRGGKGTGVYYLSDDQLVSLIPPAEKQRWEKMMADWKLVRDKNVSERAGKEWDEAVKKHLAEFGARAWRRPLTPEESTHLNEVYAAARARELDRESAGREVLVRVLVSPKFLFKLEDASQPGERRLDAWELATRLSYFLWSSAPDAQLLKAATDGSLLKPEVLAAEVKRMLRDRRAGGLGEEFAGQWLSFNGFVKTANIDPNKFPEFTPELRRDMARETSEFFAHLIREDRPVREILTADYTFLNDRLATFYGVPGVTGGEFRKVAVAANGRGGLLGMGTVLAKHSYPHRTSPVLRGHWLLTAILGTPTPPPPNDVPKLDDSASKATSLRARLEAHRKDAACSGCHDKIDPLGFALEGFDPIGRLRTKDEAGAAVDDSAQIKNGPQFRGLDGLRSYLATRETEFTDLLCRKLTGYALGRNVLPTDKLLLESMRAELKKSDGHLSAAVLTLVQSRQFQNRRND